MSKGIAGGDSPFRIYLEKLAKKIDTLTANDFSD